MTSTRLALLGVVLFGPAAAAADPVPLAARIDRLVQDRLDAAKVPASPAADDAEFLRRVFLDLAGRIPTPEQAAAFLDDTAADKRAKLIDGLIARPEYGRHLATTWRELVVDRTEDQSRVRQTFSWEFLEWLAEGFNAGRGWDRTVTAMLTAEGEVAKTPAATFIMANRQNEFPRPEDVVGTAGRLFMGVHVRCAQCHDHPSVDAWKQDDFWGLAAFFAQVRDHGIDQNGTSRAPVIAEKPNPDEKKEAMYARRMKAVGAIPPEPGAKIAIPTIEDPTKALRTVPAKFFLGESPALPSEGPYRPRFAAWLTSPENPYFARAAVNRLWAQFFARGLVNPVDDMRPGNEPTHPELLALLEKEFKAAKFDHKVLVKVICNSRTYPRTSRPVAGNAADKELYSHMPVRLLTPDQTIDSLCIAVGRPVVAGKNRDQMTLPFATKDADDPATEFSHGIPQFLLQMNAGLANVPAPPKATAGKSKEDALTALYLAALSRRPRPDEVKRMTTYLEQSKDVNQGYRDVFWVLLNSAEFVFNR